MWLILPYITEIILNIVVFYYNFVKEVSTQDELDEEEADKPEEY